MGRSLWAFLFQMNTEPQDTSADSQDMHKTTPSSDSFTRRAWLCFASGFVLLVIGHILLYLAGSYGMTAPGRFAPILIVLGYAVFGAGFIPSKRPKSDEDA